MVLWWVSRITHYFSLLFSITSPYIGVFAFLVRIVFIGCIWNAGSICFSMDCPPMIYKITPKQRSNGLVNPRRNKRICGGSKSLRLGFTKLWIYAVIPNYYSCLPDVSGLPSSFTYVDRLISISIAWWSVLRLLIWTKYADDFAKVSLCSKNNKIICV